MCHFCVVILCFSLLLLGLKDIALLIETGAYTREVRRIVRAIRWTIQLRKNLTASVLSAFLDFALLPGSEMHSRLSAYVPKVSMLDIQVDFQNLMWKICFQDCLIGEWFCIYGHWLYKQSDFCMVLLLIAYFMEQISLALIKRKNFGSYSFLLVIFCSCIALSKLIDPVYLF